MLAWKNWNSSVFKYRFKHNWKPPTISWFDLLVILVLIIGGAFYLHDVRYWSVGYVGDAPYGDAQFWWDGAVHFAQGIFQDNPGKGFRPGYFVLTGLTLPVLGWEFSDFYPYFLLSFLVITSLFYLALRYPLGRWSAAGVAGLIVFNPFTAEWLATSTTDGTGLLLNMGALTCLLFGLPRRFAPRNDVATRNDVTTRNDVATRDDGLRRGWLIGFGVLFALATLTRPLMTPFIGFVILTILCLSNVPFKKRLSITLSILIAFSVPMLLWMGIQKITINQWSISSNDASAFYAASDPMIQVWNPSMYEHISQLAKERYHVTLDERLLNHTFWVEAVKNYIKYPGYHLRRIMPDTLEIATFSPRMATHGTDLWRLTIFILIGLGLAGGCWAQWRKWHAGLLIAVTFCIYQWPVSIAYLMLLGAFVSLVVQRGRGRQLGLFLLSGYWLAGLLGLYLTGGVWGPPLQSVYAINALGYRLGAQVFYMGDLLAVYSLVWFAALKWQKSALPRWVKHPVPLLGKCVLGGCLLYFAAALFVYAIGTGQVIHQAYARLTIPAQPYPSLEPVINLFFQQTGEKAAVAVVMKGGFDTKTHVNMDKANQAWVFTGAASPFIWNFPQQQRSQLLVHTQHLIHPFSMGPGFTILEIPQHIHAKEWNGLQGAFIIKPTMDKHNTSNLPYYLTVPAVRAFIPLTPDKQHYDLAKAIWFPLAINATQLESQGLLKLVNSQVIWSQDSGEEKYQRRLFLQPRAAHDLKLLLKIPDSKQKSVLSFSYGWGNVPGEKVKPNGHYEMKVTLSNKLKKQNALTQQNDYLSSDLSLKHIKLTIPANTRSVEIAFNHLLPNTGIWIYEFNSRSQAMRSPSA